MMGGTGKWWLRGGTSLGSHNFDQIANLNTLAGWAAGGVVPTDGAFTFNGADLNANSEILGFSVGYGSFVGAFDGAIDHLTYSFNGGNTYSYNFQAVLEPGTWAALGLGTVGILRRRKRA